MLNKEELERYSRQILLFGRNAQDRLKESTVFVIGAGGLGNACLPYLVGSGIGTIVLFDDDIVERHNLSRQVCFQESHIGQKKAEVLANILQQQNPYCKVIAKARKFQLEDVNSLPNCDAVLEGSDDISTKFLINKLAFQKKIPTWIGGLGPVQGHLIPVLPNQKNSACYQCIFEKEPQSEIPTCATDGILSPMVGVFGSLMAYETVAYLAGTITEFPITILEKEQIRSLNIRPASHCPFHKNHNSDSRRNG
ncbi:MAG: HesA/MoeB/ThiF family protein [Candidatus Hydrogenedentota bacterium]|nr:MAG: HesA/MoeB/ThiF family protein [Candidatus Hydrogenedentota bacterium]